MKTPPKIQVDTMTAAQFFGYAAEVLKLQPPHLTDQPILAQLAELGFVPGKSFDLAGADPVVRQALETVPADAQRLMAWKTKSLARVANGWSMNTDTMGVYGNYYLKRAIVAQVGLGANLPEDAIYPLNLFDETGQPLDGGNDYTIHFAKADLPPADAFWSITLYDPEGYQVANTLNRFAVSSWMPFDYNGDGSLDLYFQHTSPGAGQGGQLAAGAGGALQSDDAPLRAEQRGAHRPLEPAAGRQERRGAATGSAIVRGVTSARIGWAEVMHGQRAGRYKVGDPPRSPGCRPGIVALGRCARPAAVGRRLCWCWGRRCQRRRGPVQ